jgi:hypothetical protein
MGSGQRFAEGDQGIFTGYSHLPHGTPPIFAVGTLFVVLSVDEDNVLRCLPITYLGRIINKDGDTVFPEEAIKLSYAPRVRLDHLKRAGGIPR